MRHSEESILIIGAGMGGLGLALALQRAGIAVSVYEAAPELAEIGAGLSLSPNAMHAINYIGLNDFMQEAANCPMDAILAHYKTGELLQRTNFDSDFKEEFGAEYYQIHRADMHAGLVRAVRDNDPDCIHLNHQLVDYDQDDNSATAIFANGSNVKGRAIIGADGIRSTLRSKLIEEEPPIFTGQVAYRATIQAQGMERFTEEADSSVTIGPGHIFVRYLIRHGALLNVVAIAKSDAWKEEGWNTPASREDLLAEHQGWNKDVIDLIQTAPENVFYKWALFDRKPIKQWTFGRATLLGDAAHPILPFLGMGAAMAFEDAIVLSRCIQSYEDIEHAFTRYEQARIERADDVYKVSRSHGESLQNSDPDKVDWKNYKAANDWTFFSYNPAEVEI